MEETNRRIPEDLAREAYAAYAGVTDNKNFRGEEMPTFDVLPPKIQEAWCAACMRVIKVTEA